ncbi:MAG: molybdopterin-binding protein, partial [Phenylobacterium sp.]
MNAPVLTPGGRIDEKQPIKPVRIAVLTISDTRDEESDTSGHVLAERIKAAGHELADKGIVRDHIPDIRAKVEAWVASGFIDAIITTGGTGITGRDVTPEALEPLFD